MKTTNLFLCIALTASVLACGEKKDAFLEEAGKIHNEAHDIGEGIEPQIETIDSLTALLNTQKLTLKDAAQLARVDSTVAALGSVKTAFEAWEDNIVSVPGMVHKHAEGEAHEHNHKPAPDVTSEQMLEIQKEMKTNIEKIKADLQKAEEMLKSVM